MNNHIIQDIEATVICGGLFVGAFFWFLKMQEEKSKEKREKSINFE